LHSHRASPTDFLKRESRGRHMVAMGFFSELSGLQYSVECAETCGAGPYSFVENLLGNSAAHIVWEQV
jgi:hypothetical protein